MAEKTVWQLAAEARDRINAARRKLIEAEIAETRPTREKLDLLRDGYKRALVENWLPIDAALALEAGRQSGEGGTSIPVRAAAEAMGYGYRVWVETSPGCFTPAPE